MYGSERKKIIYPKRIHAIIDLSKLINPWILWARVRMQMKVHVNVWSLSIYSLGLSTDPKTEPLATSHTPRNPLSTSRLPNTNPLCGAFSSILTRKTHSQFISYFMPLLSHLAWFLERLVASINPFPCCHALSRIDFVPARHGRKRGRKGGK